MPPDQTSRRAWAALGALVVGYLAIDVLSGPPGSPLVPVLPAGVGVPRWTVRAAGWLGLDRLGPVALTVLSILVLGLLVGAFGQIAWEAWRNRLSPGVALAAVGISLALSVAGPLLLSRDVHSYAAYGRALSVHHADPYEVAPSAFPADPFTRVVSREWIDTRSVYGPAFTLASAGITRAWSGSPARTILAFKVVSAAAVAVAVIFGAWVARRARPGREALAVAVLGLNPVVIVHTVGGGHNDALVAAFLAAALFLGHGFLRGSTISSGQRGGLTGGPGGLAGGSVGGLALGATALIVAAASVKVVALLPLLGWLWILGRVPERRDRARVLGIHLAVAIGLTAAFAAPVFAGWRTVTAMANLASRQGWASGARLIARAAQGMGRTIGGSSLGSALGALVYAAFLVVFVLLLWRVLKAAALPGSVSLWEPWGSSLLLFALAAPYLLPWYAVWFLPFLALMADGRLAVAGLAVAGLLALTGVPAEPGVDPGLWRAMLLGVHYAVAPMMLAMFVLVARRLRPNARWPERSPPPGWRRLGRRPAWSPGPGRPEGAG